LKADPADWMRRFFDAFVYTANWRSCQFSLRLPIDAFEEAELPPGTDPAAFSREFVLMIPYCFFKRIEPRAPLMWRDFNKKRSELPCEFSYRVPI
jgi:hypothetical protein